MNNADGDGRKPRNDSEESEDDSGQGDATVVGFTLLDPGAAREAENDGNDAQHDAAHDGYRRDNGKDGNHQGADSETIAWRPGGR